MASTDERTISDKLSTSKNSWNVCPVYDMLSDSLGLGEKLKRTYRETYVEIKVYINFLGLNR